MEIKKSGWSSDPFDTYELQTLKSLNTYEFLKYFKIKIEF